jgi:Zn-dependent M16 (insulinase) family peptidase
MKTRQDQKILLLVYCGSQGVTKRTEKAKQKRLTNLSQTLTKKTQEILINKKDNWHQTQAKDYNNRDQD